MLYISERRFNEVLIQMDLPPERAKILKSFPNEKKWDTVCDHDLVHAKEFYTFILIFIRIFIYIHSYIYSYIHSYIHIYSFLQSFLHSFLLHSFRDHDLFHAKEFIFIHSYIQTIFIYIFILVFIPIFTP